MELISNKIHKIKALLSKGEKSCLLLSNRIEYLDIRKYFDENPTMDFYFWSIDSVKEFNHQNRGVLIAYMQFLPLNPFIENPLQYLSDKKNITFFITEDEFQLRKSFFNGLSLNFYKANLHKKSLIIFTTQRTGSTMIAEQISSTRELGHPLELVHLLISNLKDYKDCDHENLRKTLIERSITSNGVFAVKVMINELSQFRKTFPSIYDYFKVRMNQSGFLFLYRKNLIAQALSYLHATESNIWHSSQIVGNKINPRFLVHNNLQVRPKSIPYNHHKVKKYITYFKRYKSILKLLSNQVKVKLILNYEKLCSPKNYLADIYFLIDVKKSSRTCNKGTFRKAFRLRKTYWKILYYIYEFKTFYRP